MTFSQSAKNYIVGKVIESDLSAMSELSAIVHSAGSLVLSSEGMSIELTSKTKGLGQRVDGLLKVFYSESVSIGKEERLGKTFYKVVIPPSVAVRVLEDCSILAVGEDGARSIMPDIDRHLVMDTESVRAYVRGVFLGCGYVYRPTDENRKSSGYRMEFVFDNHKLGADVHNLLREHGFDTKNILRNSKYILYLYSSDSICDLLTFMGADKPALEIYSERANRSVINDANRSANCISANIDKAVNAAVKQADAIAELDRLIGIETLPLRLKDTAAARLDNPSATLAELAALMGISKSGLSHRLEKILKIYNDLKNGG